MKYCAKCGTQMSDETVACPQCYPQQPINITPPTNSNQEHSSKKSSNKIAPLITVNIILSILILISVIAIFCVVLTSGSASGDSIASGAFTSTCPADEYGNHDWAPARCTEPAQCYNCDAYRDDKLGEHSFYTDDDGFCDCSYCGILYEVYIDSLN